MNTINGNEALNQCWYNVEPALQVYTYDELLIHLKRLSVIENVDFVQTDVFQPMQLRTGILVQVTIYRRLLIGRDGHLDQSEAYDIS